MTISLLGTLTGALLGWLMGFLSLFLIMLVLVQRGRGGGLTGALGGPGGQSAFGSKAGDTFTVITIVMASVWGFTCAFTMWLLGTHAAPTITDSNMSAAPGDEDEAINNMILPANDAGGISGFNPLGENAESSETPSMELTPADSDDAATESSIGPADGEATPEGENAEASSSEASSSEASSSEASAGEESTAEESTSGDDADE
jgi:preprotein translocase subunit SecG